MNPVLQVELPELRVSSYGECGCSVSGFRVSRSGDGLQQGSWNLRFSGSLGSTEITLPSRKRKGVLGSLSWISGGFKV